ncbi:MAG: tetratricopeptide repeat protein [Burkholderiales bacterium]
MKIRVAAFAPLFLLFQFAHAADQFLEEETARALAAGEPAVVVKALNKLVDADNVVAATELGLMYRDGKGVPADHAKARKFLKIAAAPDLVRMWHKYGFPKAQYTLAVMLRDGVGGKPNVPGAVSWFEKAAEQGYGEAELELAKMYLNGAGIKSDPERAFIWSSIAATRLSGPAQKDAEQMRDRAQGQLDPRQLAKAGNLLKNWKPRTG